MLLAGAERLDEHGSNRMLLGLRVCDPNDDVLGAWLAKEPVRSVYLTDDPSDAAALLDKAITGCTTDDVVEIQSSVAPSPRGAPRSSRTTQPAHQMARPKA